MQETPQLTPEQLLARMQDLANVFIGERDDLRDTSKAFKTKEADVMLYISRGQFDQLTVPKASEHLKNSINEKGKVTLIGEEKIALTAIECEIEKSAYEDAKFNAETTEKAFKMWQEQLSWHQSVLKAESGIGNFRP